MKKDSNYFYIYFHTFKPHFSKYYWNNVSCSLSYTHNLIFRLDLGPFKKDIFIIMYILYFILLSKYTLTQVTF